MSTEEPPRQESDSFVSFLKDNLEAIAVAVIMALVIKHFCVEAFKIPTSSMVPTLRGDHDTPGHPDVKGDRILVDKFAYLLEPPRRWDVIVFRYPLDRSRNFIKRIAGIPGERLRISRDGDLWTRRLDDEGGEDALRIPQKPRRAREQFYRRVYPPPPAATDGDESGFDTPDASAAMERYWRVEEGPPNAWRLEHHGLFAFGGGSKGVLRNAVEIRDLSEADSWAHSGNAGSTVRDVRFRMRIRLSASAEGGEVTATRVALAWRPDDAVQAVLALSTNAEESEAFIRRGMSKAGQVPLEVALQAGKAHLVELEYVDGMLRAHVDGRERAAIPDGRRFGDTWTQSGAQRFTLTAEGGALEVEGLQIDRDLCYVNVWSGNPRAEQNGIDIPADSYFMLGDNTRNSSDSRRWQVVTVHMAGEEPPVRYDKNAGVDYVHDLDETGTRKRVTDVDGIVRTWRERQEDGGRGSSTRPAPFVHRDLVVGRAFIRFWPCWPDFPGRLGFIH